MKYSEHHCHTHFSALDGVSTAEDYMIRAKDIGVDHITITDHATLAGHSEFLSAGNKHGISVGLGLEGYFSATDRFDKRAKAKRQDGTQIYNHLSIIAKDDNGLKNLREMNQEAWTSGYYHKPRIDWDLLEQYHNGLIILSGCLSGVVAQNLNEDNYDAAYEWAAKFKGLFGDDYYIELMSHNDEKITKGQFQIADELGIKTVITSDCHHASPEDLALQEAMLILSTQPKSIKEIDLSKAQKMDLLDRFNYLYPDRVMTFAEYDLHLHNGLEHFQKMSALGYGRTDFIENTNEIADKIGSYTEHHNLDLLPKPKVKDVDEHLRDKVFYGLSQLNLHDKQEYIDRANQELEVIRSKNFSTYFLIKGVIDEWAKEQDILAGPGRGSGAGSLVNYALGITKVDPLKYDLLFERFLDESRPEYPDIDSDYQDDRRDEVKQFMRRKFKNTGNIMTFTYLEGKNIVKDACKILQVPYKESNDVTSLINDFDDYLTSQSADVIKFKRKYPDVERLGKMMRGRLRSVGLHAAGVVVSSKPLSDYVAVETAKHPDDAARDRVEVLAMDADRAADLGLIKFDILGLTALTNIKDTLNLIKQRYNKDIDIYSVPLDDPDVYASITKQSSLGIFQVEGAAFTRILDKMPMESFSDIVNATALIRPGAADSSFGRKFINARNGKSWKYYCDAMIPFTEDTYGQIIFQEQLMLTVQHVAGMSAADANKIRKIIGKKKDVSELDKYRAQFVDGAEKHLTRVGAERMWDDFEKSANYQFNKSHAVAYSMVTYYTAWLKHYYPAEYMISLLRSEKDQVQKLNYFSECERLGIRLLVPHINKSGIELDIHDDENGPYLRMGLSDVKYVGPAMAKKIINKRPYTSFEHFVETANELYSGINTRAIDNLDLVGACEFDTHPLRGDESSHYPELLNLPSFNDSIFEQYTKDLFTTLGDFNSDGTFVILAMVQKIVRKNGWVRADLFDKTGTAGIFVDPSFELKKNNWYIFVVANSGLVHFVEADKANDGSPLAKYLFTEKLKPFDGYRVIMFKSRISKAGNTLGDLVLTDKDKNIMCCTVTQKLFAKTYTLAQPGAIVNAVVSEREWKGKTTLTLQEINAIA